MFNLKYLAEQKRQMRQESNDLRARLIEYIIFQFCFWGVLSIYIIDAM